MAAESSEIALPPIESSTHIVRAAEIPTMLDGKGAEREVAYLIEKTYLEVPFAVFKSANAWWMELQKVEAAIALYERDYTDEEVASALGIHVNSLYYFQQIHPDFLVVKQGARQKLLIYAKASVFKAVQKDAHLGFRVMQGMQPERYRRSVLPEIAPGGGTFARRSEEVWRDDDGNVVHSKNIEEYAKRHGDTDTPQE